MADPKSVRSYYTDTGTGGRLTIEFSVSGVALNPTPPLLINVFAILQASKVVTNLAVDNGRFPNETLLCFEATGQNNHEVRSQFEVEFLRAVSQVTGKRLAIQTTNTPESGKVMMQALASII